MKHFLTIPALLAVLLFGGCKYVHEKGCDCVTDQNLTIRFSNKDRNGNEIFPHTVNKVDIFLFDQGDRLVYRFEAPATELLATQSATVSVAPGTYRIVCWGNSYDNSRLDIVTGDLCADGLVCHTATGTSTGNGDPLYYAPYNRTQPQMFTVPVGQQKTVDVRMRAAHIKMDFTVRGYAAATGATEHPYIEIANLYPRYDFSMEYVSCAAMSFIQQTRTSTRAGDVSEQQFNTPRFENDNPVMIYLRKTPGSAPLVTLALKDELVAKALDVTTEIELTIPFVITFTGDEDVDMDVSISIGDWKNASLDPDIW